MKLSPTIVFASLACALAASHYAFADDDDDDEIPFDAAEIFFELNDTDGDLGHPQGSPDISIYNYEVVVEAELEDADGEEFLSVFSVLLPPDVTSMTVPEEFISQSDEFKFEVLAREESFNQTAVESCFLLNDDS